jgi:hypothetical protein
MIKEELSKNGIPEEMIKASFATLGWQDPSEKVEIRVEVKVLCNDDQAQDLALGDLKVMCNLKDNWQESKNDDHNKK